MKEMKEVLRHLKTLDGPFPKFDLTNVPEDPYKLFQDWLKVAIYEGVKEPHAMTLSTIDQNGCPDARVLILKNVNENGWCFASNSESKKGQQLISNSEVALTFYWSLIGRQVRIRGTAIHMGEEASAKDFLARGKIARACTLIGKQSNTLADLNDLDEALLKQLEIMKRDPNIVDPNWVLYCVKAEEVEFWQGDTSRKHIRLQYRLIENNWIRELLWP